MRNVLIAVFVVVSVGAVAVAVAVAAEPKYSHVKFAPGKKGLSHSYSRMLSYLSYEFSLISFFSFYVHSIASIVAPG